MQTLDQEHDEMKGELTSALIRTILESRRALRLALSMLREMTQAGNAVVWRDEEPVAEDTLPATLSGSLKLEASVAEGVHFSKRSPRSRAPLRLVTPFRNSSPIVLPDFSESGDEKLVRPTRERAELDALDGSERRTGTDEKPKR